MSDLSGFHAVLVTGSRVWDDKGRVYAWLDRIFPILVIHGGAAGADTLAHAWCKSRGRQARVFFPDWSQGKGAALRRNNDMVGVLTRCAPTSVVLGFPLPQSRGTYYTMRAALEAGLTVYDGAAEAPREDATPWRPA